MLVEARRKSLLTSFRWKSVYLASILKATSTCRLKSTGASAWQYQPLDNIVLIDGLTALHSQTVIKEKTYHLGNTAINVSSDHDRRAKCLGTLNEGTVSRGGRQ